MAAGDKPLIWLNAEVRTPPFSQDARVEAGSCFAACNAARKLSMPHSRPMPVIGARCHELRVVDAGKTWRTLYRLDPDAVIIADVFQKTTQQTPQRVITNVRRRLRLYDTTVEVD